MTRYIDADLLMKELGITDPDCVKCEWGSKLFPFCTRDGDFVDACDAICEAPTIDAVEVVRCKDCKHYEWADNRAFGMPTKYCSWTGFEDVDDNDFCSRGKRREDATD